MVGREETREVRAALDGLPASQRKVLELAYFGGFTHREIATMPEEPLGTIKGRMRLGLEKLGARSREMPRHDRAAPRILEDLGAYALHALPDKEARDLEVHLRGCPACQHELERLKVAADALARSVDPVPPPPGLRQRVVEVVRAEEGAAPRSRKAERRAERRRLAALLPRPAIRPAVAATLAALAAGLAGWALGSAGGPEARTVAVAVDRARLPTASGELSVDRAGESAVLRLAGIPKLGPGQTYELWVERDDRVRPGPLFQPNPRGSAVTGVAGDLSEVEAILVTREAAGGARTPSEPPVVQARLE